jgi:hypothetical protein
MAILWGWFLLDLKAGVGCRKTLVLKSCLLLNTTPCSALKWSDVSEEYVASIFRVEENKQETNMKQVI